MCYNVRARRRRLLCPEILDTACIARPRSISCLLNWIRNGFFIPWMYAVWMRRYIQFPDSDLVDGHWLSDGYWLTISRRIRQRAYLPRDFDCRVFHVVFLFPWQTVLVSLCVHFSFKTINNKPTTTQQPNNKKKNGWHFGLWFLYNRRKKRQEIRFRRHLFSIIPCVGKKTPNVHMYTLCCCIHPSIHRESGWDKKKSQKHFLLFYLFLKSFSSRLDVVGTRVVTCGQFLPSSSFPPHLFPFFFFLKTT